MIELLCQAIRTSPLSTLSLPVKEFPQDLPTAPPPRARLLPFDPENPRTEDFRRAPFERRQFYDFHYELLQHTARRAGPADLARTFDEMRTNGVQATRDQLVKDIQRDFPGIDIKNYKAKGSLEPLRGGEPSRLQITSGEREWETNDSRKIQNLHLLTLCDKLIKAQGLEGGELPRGFVNAFLNRCRHRIHDDYLSADRK